MTLLSTNTGEEVLALELRRELGPIDLAFNQRGTRLVARARSGATVAWELPSGQLVEGEPAPTDLIIPSTTPLEGAALQIRNSRGWLEIERRVNRDRVYDPWAEYAAGQRQAAAYWHAHDAKTAEEVSDWFAAVFHLDRLIRLTPDDSSLPDRRKAAAGRLAPEVLAILDRSNKAAEEKP